MSWSCKSSQPSTGYLPSGVNLLTNIPKTSPNTSGGIFQINLTENDKNTSSKLSHGDLPTIWDSFTCWLPNPLLRRCSLESFLTKILTFCSFGNTLTMTINFSFKMFKIWCRFQKCKKKKNRGKVFPFSDNCISIGSCKFYKTLKRILAIASQYVNKNL